MKILTTERIQRQRFMGVARQMGLKPRQQMVMASLRARIFLERGVPLQLLSVLITKSQRQSVEGLSQSSRKRKKTRKIIVFSWEVSPLI